MSDGEEEPEEGAEEEEEPGRHASEPPPCVTAASDGIRSDVADATDSNTRDAE